MQPWDLRSSTCQDSVDGNDGAVGPQGPQGIQGFAGSYWCNGTSGSTRDCLSQTVLMVMMEQEVGPQGPQEYKVLRDYWQRDLRV